MSPAPDFFGAERQEVTRGGIRFVIYRSGAEVEVVRMGYLSRPARAAVPRLMAEAVEEATGCPVVPGSMTADPRRYRRGAVRPELSRMIQIKDFTFPV
ncbi:MAG: hypothetical protein R3D61_12885 [Defluviimonas denitrificans]